MSKEWQPDELAMIARNFDLEAPGRPVTEEELVAVLAERIANMMDGDRDMLLSLLYRLDIEEHKINKAMAMNQLIPTNVGLARLIIERQKERNESRKKYKQDNIDGWDF